MCRRKEKEEFVTTCIQNKPLHVSKIIRCKTHGGRPGSPVAVSHPLWHQDYVSITNLLWCSIHAHEHACTHTHSLTHPLTHSRTHARTHTQMTTFRLPRLWLIERWCQTYVWRRSLGHNVFLPWCFTRRKKGRKLILRRCTGTCCKNLILKSVCASICFYRCIQHKPTPNRRSTRYMQHRHRAKTRVGSCPHLLVTHALPWL